MSQPKDEYIKEETMDDLWNVWFTELHQGKSGLTFRITRVLESTESEFQRIEVIETEEFGKALVLYGSLMIAEGDTGASFVQRLDGAVNVGEEVAGERRAVKRGHHARPSRPPRSCHARTFSGD